MNVSDIISRVQRQFGDESGVQVLQSDIIRWINDAQREAVVQHDGLLSKEITGGTLATFAFYNIPSDCLDILTVEYKLSGDTVFYALQYMSKKQLNEYMPGWSGLDADVPKYWTRGRTEGSILLVPGPAASGDQYRIVYSRYATDIEDETSPIDLPQYYHPFVLEFCLMKAYEMDENWDAADRKASYVQSTLDANNARESWTGKETYPSVTPVSEDYV